MFGWGLNPAYECDLIFHNLLTECRAWVAPLAAIVLGGTVSLANPAFAQNDLGPIAAPTSSISVGTLPVVRSESQQLTDYARGLFEGLLVREGIPRGALVIVSRDRVDMAEVFGEDVGENALFALGTLSDLFGVVSAMQLVQEARLFPAEDLAAAVGEPVSRGVTLGDLLSNQLDDSANLLALAVEHASALAYDEYISNQILDPLGMARSRFEIGVGMLVTAGDMSQFLGALVGNSGARGGSILLPATLELMRRGHYSRHPALPGWSYGFAEMERNGWRALQRDGVLMESSYPESRIVIIPELQVAYFVSVTAGASAEFWRTLDSELFDQLAPQRAAPANLRTSPEPSPQDTLEVEGLYRPRVDADDGVFLTAKEEPLRIEAAGANLHLSGAENLELRPIAGGAWRSEGALIPAAFVDGVFWLGSTAYVPVPSWQTPGNYLVAAAILGLLAFLALVVRAREPALMGLSAQRSQEIIIGLAGLTAILISIAVVLHSWT